MRQCPLLASSVRGPQMVWECQWEWECVCVDGMNLKYALRWHIHIIISSFRTMPVLYTHTRILKPFEDSELAGLKVDIAEYAHLDPGTWWDWAAASRSHPTCPRLAIQHRADGEIMAGSWSTSNHSSWSSRCTLLTITSSSVRMIHASFSLLSKLGFPPHDEERQLYSSSWSSFPWIVC